MDDSVFTSVEGLWLPENLLFVSANPVRRKQGLGGV
jgi:hypothetical protein